MVRIRVNHQIHFILNKMNNNNIIYNTQSILRNLVLRTTCLISTGNMSTSQLCHCTSRRVESLTELEPLIYLKKPTSWWNSYSNGVR